MPFTAKTPAETPVGTPPGADPLTTPVNSPPGFWRNILSSKTAKGVYVALGVTAKVDVIHRNAEGQPILSAIGSTMHDAISAVDGLRHLDWTTSGERWSDPRVSMLTETQFRDKRKDDLRKSGKAAFDENGVSFVITKDNATGKYTLGTQDGKTKLGTGDMEHVVGWASSAHYLRDATGAFANAMSEASTPSQDAQETRDRTNWLNDLRSKIGGSAQPPNPDQTSDAGTAATGTQLAATIAPSIRAGQGTPALKLISTATNESSRPEVTQVSRSQSAAAASPFGNSMT